MPIDDILYGVIRQAKSCGNEKLINMAVFDVWEKHEGKDLNNPKNRLQYSCDVISTYYTTLEYCFNVTKKYPNNA